MTVLGLTFTLLSSLGWASFDALRKRMVHRVSATPLVVWINVVQVPGFIVWSVLEHKLVSSHEYLYYLPATLSLNVVANYLFLKSVHLSPLSSTIPLLGLTPVFTALIGATWLGETPTMKQWVGITAVVTGAFGLNANVRDLARPWQLFANTVRDRGSSYMTVVALLWSAAPFFDKQALLYAGVGVHGALVSGGVALSMAIGLFAGNRQRELAAARHIKGALGWSAACALVAFGCQLVAIQLVFVSLFEGLKRGIGMLLAVVSGRVFFSEPVRPVKAFAVLLMTSGVLLLV